MTAPEQPTPLLPCPFCGGTNIDPREWLRGDGVAGPGCSDCGATAQSTAEWNRRTAAQRAAEAVEQRQPTPPPGDAPAPQRPLITDHRFDGGSFGGGDQGECVVCGRDAYDHAPQRGEAVAPPGDAGERAREIVEAAFDAATQIVSYRNLADPFERVVFCQILKSEIAAALQSERTAAASSPQVVPPGARARARAAMMGVCTHEERIAIIASEITAAASQARRETAARCMKAARGEDANRGAANEIAAAYIQGRLDAVSDIRALATPQESA